MQITQATSVSSLISSRTPACQTIFDPALGPEFPLIQLYSFTKPLLSAGQRQRILLARALLAKPSLIVLDEATSHLDIETESRILQKLRSIAGTKVVISHRPDVAAFADRVVSMSAGRVHGVQVLRK